MKKIMLFVVAGILIFVFGFLAGSFWMSMKFVGSFGVGSRDSADLSAGHFSGESFWAFQYFGGMSVSEDRLKPAPQGKGQLQVKMTYNQGPAAGVKCKMFLNGKFKTSDQATDANGILSFRLPEGKWQVNAIQCGGWINKPAGDMMLVLPGQRRWDMSYADQYRELRETGKEVAVSNKAPEAPQISLLLNPRVELVWPEKTRLKQKASSGRSKISWKAYPQATDYRVTLHRVTREDRRTTYVPILYKKISGKNTLALSGLAHTHDPKAKEEYAVTVEAYGENGEFLSESQSFDGTFTLTDGNVLVEDMHDTLGSTDQETLDSLYRDRKILDTAETLIKEKMYDQAEALLNKVNVVDLQGKKLLLTGYVHASKGDCKKAQLSFDAAQKKGEECVPDEYKSNCK